MLPFPSLPCAALSSPLSFFLLSLFFFSLFLYFPVHLLSFFFRSLCLPPYYCQTPLPSVYFFSSINQPKPKLILITPSPFNPHGQRRTKCVDYLM
ncbi:hypothetical protein LINPERPRIM_LOCUS6284, partial [Linum perenne]